MNNKQKAAEFMGEEVISLMKSVLAKHDLAILEESYRMIQEAVAAERERCAKVCETGVDTEHPTVKGHIMKNFGVSSHLAAAIRKGE
jgi:hypothetical protein